MPMCRLWYSIDDVYMIPHSSRSKFLSIEWFALYSYNLKMYVPNLSLGLYFLELVLYSKLRVHRKFIITGPFSL